MDRQRFEKIDGLLQAALAIEADARAGFLDHACAGDEALRGELEALLGKVSEAARLDSTAIAYVAKQMAAPEEDESLVGRQIGHYHIKARIGAGGMGQVWRAWDERLKREVAIKILPPEFSADAERVLRFEQEAFAVSTLNHPNIITIHEVGQSGDLHFIVTELIEGQTLRDYARQSGQSQPGWREAVTIAAQMAGALSAAHTAGIIHRDIKPENVMVQASGHVKVLDFGIAKWVSVPASDSTSNDSTVQRIQTSMGVRPGTVRYMSPEQARGEPVDARTDIFSFGIVLYELLAGQRPYDEAGTEEMIRLLTSEKEIEPVSSVCHEIPAALDRIVAKSLRKRRDERYPTASALLADLEELRALIEVGGRGQRLVKTQNANRLLTQSVALYSSDKKTRLQLGALWTVWRFADLKSGRLERDLIRKSLFGGLAGAGWRILSIAAMTMVVTAALSVREQWEAVRLSDGHTAAARQLAFSPDGRHLVSSGEDNKVIVWDFERRTQLRTLTEHRDWVTALAFSPDGTMFVTGAKDGMVIVWDAISLEKVRILGPHRKEVLSVAFSPDGRMLASASGPDGRMIIWHVGQWQTVRDEPWGNYGYCNLIFSPDGRWLMSGSRTVWDINDNRLETFPDSWNWAALSPDATVLVSVGTGGGGRVRFWALNRARGPSGSEIIADYPGHQDNGKAAAFSPDGRMAATAAENIILWDVATRTELTRLRYSAFVWGLTFSPNGRWLVSSHSDGAILVWDVATRDLVANFNGHCKTVRAVGFSADGRRIASAGEDHTVLIWDAESRRQEAALIEQGHSTQVTSVAFSPDGQSIASCDQDGVLIYWDIGQRRPRWRLKKRYSYSLAISPDGRWVATHWGVYESAGGRELADPYANSWYEQPAGGEVYGMSFSKDSKRLACALGGGQKLILVDSETWRVAESHILPNSNPVSVSFSPDGKRLVTGENEGTVRLWQASPLRPVAVLGRHDSRVNSVDFSPDGERAASSGDDKTVRLWNVRGWRSSTLIDTRTGPVLSVAFSPEKGRPQLVSGGHDGTVNLYTRHRTLWGFRLD